jgi:2-polyprenyl-3-methyl-5-hydroxy-6-metoxy-1,4-benzoquinol methylase
MSDSTDTSFNYDSIPVGYYDQIFNRGKGIQSKWHHLKFRRVAREFPAKGRHLDVACGPGTFMGTLPVSIESIGVDIAVPQIEYASKHYASANREFRTMAPGRLPYDDASFDIVTSVELIEHISSEESGLLLKDCLRVLKPGGKIIVTTPNYACFWPVLEFALNRSAKVSYEDQHITKYKPRRLRETLETAGFSGVKVETCLFAAPFAAALGWGFADTIEQLEPGFLVRNLGHLLIGTASKL